MTTKTGSTRSFSIISAVMCFVFGCAPQADQQSNPQAGSPASQPTSAATTAPSSKPTAPVPATLPAKAMLSLDQIEPKIDQPKNVAYNKPLPQQANKSLDEAKKFILQKNIADAINELERASGFDPDNPTVRKALGLAYFDLPNIGNAQQNLLKAAKYLADDVELQLILGQIAAGQKQNNKAITFLRTALKCSDATPSNPKAAIALLHLQMLLEKEGYLTACEQCLATLSDWITKHGADYTDEPLLAELSTNPEKLLVARGGVLLKLRQPQQAIKFLESAYRRDHSNTTAMNLMFEAMLETKDFDLAAKTIVSIAGDPQMQANAAAMAVKLCHISGQKDLPLRIWDELVGKKVQSQTLANALAKVCTDMGANNEAVALAKRISADMQNDSTVGESLAMIYARSGNYKSMLESLAGAITAKDFDPAALSATIEQIAGGMKPEQLDKLINAAAETDKSDKAFASHYAVGLIARALGNTKVADEQLAQSHKINKNFLPAYEARLDTALDTGDQSLVNKIAKQANSLEIPQIERSYIEGRIEFEKGEYEAASGLLKAALNKDENYAPAIIYLAKTYIESGKTRDAVTLLSSAIARKTENNAIYDLLFNYYMNSPNSESASIGMVNTYIDRKPNAIEPKLMKLEYYIRTNQGANAVKLLAQLKNNFPDNINVRLMETQIAITQFEGFLPKSDYDAFATQLEELLGSQPGNKRATMMLGTLQFQHQNYKQACETYSHVVGKTVRDYQSLVRYVVSMIQAGEYQKAAEFAEKTFKGDDKSIGQRLAYQAMLKAEKYPELLKKIEAWEDADSADSDAEDAWAFKKLYVLCKTKKFDKVVAIAMECNDVNKLLAMHDLILTSKQPETARKILDKIEDEIGQVQENVRSKALQKTRFDYATIQQLIAEDRITKAIDKTGEMLEQWTDSQWSGYSVTPLDTFTAAMTEAHKADQALAAVDKWVATLKADKLKDKDSLTPKAMSCLMTSIRLKALLGKDKEAISAIDRLLKITDDDAGLYELKSNSLQNIGKNSEAIKALEKAYKLDSTDVGMNNNLSYCYIEAGLKPETAEQMITFTMRECAKRGSIPDAYNDTYAWLLYKKGQFSKAGGIFRDMIERWDDPTTSSYYAVMLDHAADTFYRLGWKEKAVDLWKKAAIGINKDPYPSRERQTVGPLLEQKIKAAADGHPAPLAKTFAELSQSKPPTTSTSKAAETKPADKEDEISVPDASPDDL